MSQYLGVLRGSSKTPADRRGSRHSGISATLGTRKDQLRLVIWHAEGVDYWRLERVRGGLQKATGILSPDTAPEIHSQSIHDAEGRN